MKKFLILGGLFMMILQNTNSIEKKTVYDFSAVTMQGENKSLSDYKDKVILIVNTASKCGFTPQFAGLEALYKKYKDKGLVILGFPTNQFASQDPGTNEEIASFCQLNYGVTFQIFQKIDVNGENAHPLYKFLVKEKGSILGNSIKWNFTKFLVDKKGNVVKRIPPQTEPEKMDKDITALLK